MNAIIPTQEFKFWAQQNFSCYNKKVILTNYTLQYFEGIQIMISCYPWSPTLIVQ